MNDKQRAKFEEICRVFDIDRGKLALASFIATLAVEEWARGQREMAEYMAKTEGAHRDEEGGA